MLTKTDYGDILEFKAARTIMGRPLYYNYFFFVDGLLIDTGPPHVSSEIIAALKKLPIEKVAITHQHQHEDHTGNCYPIQKDLGVPVYAHPETIKVLANPPAVPVYRKIMWGNLPRAEASPLGNTIITNSYTFQVINTPGHSADHVSFFEPQNRWLFCGDLYLGEKLTGFMFGENIAEHLRSLQNIILLKPKTLFCGLKGRLDNAVERLTRKYNFWWDIGCRVRELDDANIPRKQILSKVFGGETIFYYISQSNWGRRFMLDSIIDNITFFEAGQKKGSLAGPGSNR